MHKDPPGLEQVNSAKFALINIYAAYRDGIERTLDMPRYDCIKSKLGYPVIIDGGNIYESIFTIYVR